MEDPSKKSDDRRRDADSLVIADAEMQHGAPPPPQATATSGSLFESSGEASGSMRLTALSVDAGEHTRDGLLLHAMDGTEPVLAFISRRVMDEWANLAEPSGRRMTLFRGQYNALGQRNLPAIERIVTSKYRRGPASNSEHPFVDVLLSDIVESGEVLDLGRLAR